MDRRKRAIDLILEAFHLQNKVKVRLHRRTAEEVGFYGLTSHLDDGRFFVEVWQALMEEMELTLLHEVLHTLLWSKADEESDFEISHSFIYLLEKNLKRIGWRLPAELHPVHGAPKNIDGKAARIVRGLLRLGIPLEVIPIEKLEEAIKMSRGKIRSDKSAPRRKPRGKRFETAVIRRLQKVIHERNLPISVVYGDKYDERGIDILLQITNDYAKKLPKSRRSFAIDLKTDAPQARNLSHSVADRQDPFTGKTLTAYVVRVCLVGDYVEEPVWRSAIRGATEKILELASRVFLLSELQKEV